jgi:hypothetical protein
MSQNLDNTLVQWAELLSSHDTDNFLSLFTGDCIYEDMAFGLVNHGTKELHDYIDGIFAAFPDLHIELKSRMVAGERGAMEWVMRGTHHMATCPDCLRHTKHSRFGEPQLLNSTTRGSGVILTTGMSVPS